MIHALHDMPNEAGGYVIYHEHYKKLDIHKAENIAEDKQKNCILKPADYVNAALWGEIRAVYHSHCTEGSFSEIDKKAAEKLNLPIILYKIPTKEFEIYYPEKYHNQYENLEFEIGKQDCFTLFQNYYKNELNVMVKNYLPDRDSNWYKKGIDHIQENIKDSPFNLIIDNNYEKNDIIVLEYGKHKFHFCICLGQNQILHHPAGRKSCIEILSDKYIKKIKYALRLKT